MLLQREDARGRSRLFDVAGNMGGGGDGGGGLSDGTTER